MIALAYTPRWSEINDYYGFPDTDGDGAHDQKWLKEKTDWFPLPWPLVASWNPKKVIAKVRMHKLVGPAYVNALFAIGRRIGTKKIIENGWNVTGGVLADPRPMKGTPQYLSLHAYGIAADHNPDIAGWQVTKAMMMQTAEGAVFVAECLDVFYEEFTARGFVSGGDFPEKYVDFMHWQAAGM